MIVSNCPRCAEVFRVPDADMPDDAYAACPWCKETFPLVEVLHRLPPVLHIVSAEGQTLDFLPRRSAIASGISTAGSPDPSPLPGGHADDSPRFDQSEYHDGGIGTLTDDESDDLSHKTVSEETVAETWTDVPIGDNDSSAADFDIEDSNDTWEESDRDSGDVRPIAPMKVTPAPAMTRASRGSSARTLLSIVLGALAAGPLAVAILWVLTLFGVDVDLGFWPLNGHSEVVRAERVAAAPGTPSDDRASVLNSGIATGRPLAGGFDSDASSSDLSAASPIDADDPAVAAAQAIAGDTSPPANRDGSRDGTAGSGMTTNELPDKFVMPDDSATPAADRLAPPDADFAITLPPIDSSASAISPAAGADDKVATTQDVPPRDDPRAIAMPDVAASATPSAPRRSVDVETTAAAEPSPASQRRPVVRPATVETSQRDLGGGDAALDATKPTTVAQAAVSEEPTIATVPAAQPELAPETLQIESPQISEPAEVVEAATRARDMLDQLASADRSDPRKTKLLMRDTYVAIARVGAVADTASESVSNLLREVKASPDLDVWSQAGPAWLDLGNRRPTEGVLLVGKPESDSSGQWIAITDDKVIGLADDSTRLPKSSRVLGLGRILQGDSGPTVSLVAAESLP